MSPTVKPTGARCLEMGGATDAHDVVPVVKDGSARMFPSCAAKAA